MKEGRNEWIEQVGWGRWAGCLCFSLKACCVIAITTTYRTTPVLFFLVFIYLARRGMDGVWLLAGNIEMIIAKRGRRS